MLQNYRIIDADSHVYEPHQMWQSYLEAPFKSYALTPELTLDGECILQHDSPPRRAQSGRIVTQAYPQSWLRDFDAESHVQVMMEMGVDVTFIYPTYLSWVLGVDTIAPELAGAFVRAYNRWLYDFCSYDPHRLQGVGVVNRHAPEEMVPEVERIADFGWRAVVVCPNPVKGRLLSDPAYDPFWAACESAQIAVSIHTATHSRLPTAGADRFHSRFALHTCSHPMEQMMALLALIEGGVLERYPRLRVGFLESGCGWLPYWLWRLDRQYEDLYWEVADTVKMKPSEYFRRQCFIAMEPSEAQVGALIEEIGAECLLFGSDYPHVDHDPEGVADMVKLQTRFSHDVISKILWENPSRFYGLDASMG